MYNLVTTFKGKDVMKKYLTKENFSAFLFGLLSGASPLALGVYPFGAAVLTAWQGNILPFAAGALIPTLFLGEYPVITAVTVIYTAVIRLLFSSRPPLWWRSLLLSLAESALLGVAIFTGEQPSPARTVAAICVLAVPPAVSMSVFFRSKGGLAENIFILSAGIICLRGLGLINPFGFPLSVAAAVYLTAVISSKKGFPFSGAAGFVFGIAGGVQAIPAVGIFGLIHGLFVYDAPVFALILAYMISVTASAYILSFSGVLPIAVSAAAGALAYLPFCFIKPQVKKQTEDIYPDKGMASLAAGFSSLSGLFFTMSEQTLSPPRDAVYRDIKEKLDTLCTECGGCHLDKGRITEYLTDLCVDRREVLGEDMPSSLRKNCPYYQDIALIPREAVRETEAEANRIYGDFAARYKCFSNMLAASARKAEEEQAEDASLVPKVEKVLDDNGIYYEKVRVTGVRMRKVEIFGVRPDSIRISSGELSRIIARAVGRCLCPPEFVCCDEKTTAVFTTVAALRTEAVKLVTARDGESLCGDTVNMFENAENCFYSLVADGMGSGREANMVSRLASLYLEKIIGVGCDMNSAVMMLGDTLSGGQGETFTTVDLLEADRVLARAKIIKAGAPPSYLIRDGKQYVIKSKTPPLGIIKEVMPKQTTFSLRRGDIILMVSDGVDVSPSAIHKSFCAGKKDLRACAATLAQMSRDNGNCDDMSVCAVRFY